MGDVPADAGDLEARCSEGRRGGAFARAAAGRRRRRRSGPPPVHLRIDRHAQGRDRRASQRDRVRDLGERLLRRRARPIACPAIRRSRSTCRPRICSAASRPAPRCISCRRSSTCSPAGWSSSSASTGSRNGSRCPRCWPIWRASMPCSRAIFRSCGGIIWCGEVFATPALRYWMERVPHASFTNLYGPTETTIASSYFTGRGAAFRPGRQRADRARLRRRDAAHPRPRPAPAAAGRGRRDRHRRRRRDARLLARSRSAPARRS